MQVGIKCHFLIVQFQEFALDVGVVLKVLLDKLEGFRITQKQLFGAEVVNEVQVKSVLSYLKVLDLLSIIQFYNIVICLLQRELSNI